jgi:hypothetical protein
MKALTGTHWNSGIVDVPHPFNLCPSVELKPAVDLRRRNARCTQFVDRIKVGAKPDKAVMRTRKPQTTA